MPLTKILDYLLELAAATLVYFSTKNASPVREFLFCDLIISTLCVCVLCIISYFMLNVIQRLMRRRVGSSVILEIPARPMDFLTARERPFSWGQRDALILSARWSENYRHDGLTGLVLSRDQRKC